MIRRDKLSTVYNVPVLAIVRVYVTHLKKNLIHKWSAFNSQEKSIFLKNLNVGHMLLPMAKDKYNFTENFLLSVIGWSQKENKTKNKVEKETIFI
jgi:hypothetical protein